MDDTAAPAAPEAAAPPPPEAAPPPQPEAAEGDQGAGSGSPVEAKRSFHDVLLDGVDEMFCKGALAADFVGEIPRLWHSATDDGGTFLDRLPSCPGDVDLREQIEDHKADEAEIAQELADEVAEVRELRLLLDAPPCPADVVEIMPEVASPFADVGGIFDASEPMVFATRSRSKAPRGRVKTADFAEDAVPRDDPTYVWRANPGACKLCQAYDGKVFAWSSSGRVPGQAHPGCTCTAQIVVEPMANPAPENSAPAAPAPAEVAPAAAAATPIAAGVRSRTADVGGGATQVAAPKGVQQRQQRQREQTQNASAVQDWMGTQKFISNKLNALVASSAAQGWPGIDWNAIGEAAKLVAGAVDWTGFGKTLDERVGAYVHGSVASDQIYDLADKLGQQISSIPQGAEVDVAALQRAAELLRSNATKTARPRRMCRDCGGTGGTIRNACPACEGLGHVPRPPKRRRMADRDPNRIRADVAQLRREIAEERARPRPDLAWIEEIEAIVAQQEGLLGGKVAFLNDGIEHTPITRDVPEGEALVPFDGAVVDEVVPMGDDLFGSEPPPMEFDAGPDPMSVLQDVSDLVPIEEEIVTLQERIEDHVAREETLEEMLGDRAEEVHDLVVRFTGGTEARRKTASAPTRAIEDLEEDLRRPRRAAKPTKSDARLLVEPINYYGGPQLSWWTA